MKRLIKDFYNIIKKIMTNMKKDNVSEYTAQCAYYTILSFIPFIILLITTIQYTNIEQEALINAVTRIFPTNMEDVIFGIVQEVYSKSVGTISISLIFTLWSSGRSVYALAKGFQSIYNITDSKQTNYFYLRIISIIETMIFIIIIVIGLTLLVFGKSLISVFQKHFGIFENLDLFSSILTEIGFILATFFVFLCLYKLILKKICTWKSQILGAAFGAIFLNIISIIFSVYLDIFKGFSITYGSLTTLVLVMMWTYSCFYMVFVGAEINKFINRNVDRHI